MTTTGARRWAWGPAALIAAAVAFGVTLRWWQLGATSLWFDEGYTAWVVSLPPAKIIEAIRVDTAPPLYYLLLHAWVLVAGTTEAAMRLPSAICATAALGVMAAIVRRLFRDPWARAVAIALVACSFMQVAYAHEVRFYAMMALLGAVDLYLAVRSCERERPTVGWVAASAAAWTFSLWLNNIMVLYLGCLGLAWLLLPGRRSIGLRLCDVLVVAVVAAIAFAPWVPTMLAQRRAVQANFWSHPPILDDLWTMLRLVAGVNEAGRELGGPGLVLAAAVTAALAHRRRRVVAALALLGIAPVVATFVYSRHATSIFMDRAFLISSLVVPLLAAVPLEVIVERGRRALAGGLAACLVILSVLSAIQDRHRVPDHVEDWRGACRYAASLPADHRLTLFNANEGELLYDYYARGGDFAPSPDRTGTPGGYFDLHPARTLQRVRGDADLDPLRRRLGERPTDDVVFMSAHGPYADAGGLTLRLLRGRMRQVDERLFDAVTVYRFVPSPLAPRFAGVPEDVTNPRRAGG